MPESNKASLRRRSPASPSAADRSGRKDDLQSPGSSRRFFSHCAADGKGRKDELQSPGSSRRLSSPSSADRRVPKDDFRSSRSFGRISSIVAAAAAGGSRQPRRLPSAVKLKVTRRISSLRRDPAAAPLARSASDPVVFAGLSASETDLWAVKVLDRRCPSELRLPPATPNSLQPGSSSPTSTACLPNWEEAKVVVSVTVEGSTGPLRVMVRLGLRVEEVIALVLDQYRREGRRPLMDPAASADAFQLHHSHFPLKSLNKEDKIGVVGNRTFYLRSKIRSSKNLYFERQGSFTSGSGSVCYKDFYLDTLSTMSSANDTDQVPLDTRKAPLVPADPSNVLLAFFERKLQKVGRRTRRFWRIITCIIFAR